MDIKVAIQQVADKNDLSEAQAYEVMGQIFRGEATPAQIASLLVALKMKGESSAEVTGFARQMREQALVVNNPGDLRLVDTCGTGGDARNTFNISTTAAFIAAGAGVKIAKHGNRFASSSCGSADVLEALGVNLMLTAAQVEECIREVGIGFLFAPNHHLAMKNVLAPRKEIGIRTVFNLLGPLTNPAGAEAQVVGVFSYQVAPLMAETLHSLGTKRAFIVHGTDGLDEISITAPTRICELAHGRITEYVLDPVELGLEYATLQDIQGGTAAENAAILTRILDGEAGPKRDVALLNGAAAILVAAQAADFKEALDLARFSIDSGRAKAALENFIAFSWGHSPNIN